MSASVESFVPTSYHVGDDVWGNSVWQVWHMPSTLFWQPLLHSKGCLFHFSKRGGLLTVHEIFSPLPPLLGPQLLKRSVQQYGFPDTWDVIGYEKMWGNDPFASLLLGLVFDWWRAFAGSTHPVVPFLSYFLPKHFLWFLSRAGYLLRNGSGSCGFSLGDILITTVCSFLGGSLAIFWWGKIWDSEVSEEVFNWKCKLVGEKPHFSVEQTRLC